MSQKSFSAAVDDWVKKSQLRMEIVFKESTQRIIAEMQKVGPSKKNPGGGAGGHMPVDLGYLRASLTASLNANEAGITVPPDDAQTFSYKDNNVAMTILSAKLGDTIYAVYTAIYANRMEYGFGSFPGYGFVRLAAQKWDTVVEQVVAEAKLRAP